MGQQFVGRGIELAFLEEKYFSDQAELIVIHGRRRIGKTELIHQFSKEKPHVHFQCEKSGSAMILEEFQGLIEKSLNDNSLGKLIISGWDELFRELQGRFEEIDNPQNDDTLFEGKKEKMDRKSVDPGGDGKMWMYY